MNLTLEGEKLDKQGSRSNVQFITFNQDYSSISIGTKLGYSLYTLDNDIDQLQKTFQGVEHTDICIVERLFSSSLVVIVSLLSPRKLRLYHIKKRTEISIHSYTNTILSVKLNRKRLIICLEDQLYIHSLKDDLTVKWVIRNIPPNPNGLCALSPSEDRCFLAYPASQRSGEVQIFDTVELKNKILIPAHDNPLAALSFNQQSTMLASASEKGTVIRVHSIDEGQCLYEFRRGYARCVDIYSLSFSLDSLFLAASSSTETVHIFRLDQTKDDQQSTSIPNQSTWGSYLGKALVQSSTYISSHVSDMLHQWRSFATCRLPFKQLKNVCAITTIDKQPRVLVVSSEGYLYIYDLDVNEGGDCILVKQHHLEEPESTTYPLHRDSSSHGATKAFAMHQEPSHQHPSCERGPGSSTNHTSSSSNTIPPLDTTHHYDNEFPPLDQQVHPQIGLIGSRGSLSRN